MAGEAAVGAKQVKIDYNNFIITVDGQPVNLLGKEPFAINGTIYLPLRVVGEALNSSVNWQNETKTVSITSGPTAEVNSLRLQLTSKEQEIENLKKQVAVLQKQLAEGEDLSNLERDLIDDYDEIGDVPVDDITLDGDEDEVDVEVEVDLYRYEDEWNDLRDRDIENWLEDLVEYIQDELSEDTEINGEIINIDNGDVLVDFYKDGDDDLEVDYEDDDYRGGGSGSITDVAQGLSGESYYVGDIEFAVDNVSYNINDIVTVHMDAEDDDAYDLWDDLSTGEIENDVEDICVDIAETFENDANADPEVVRIYFYDENSDLLESYDYDVAYGSLD
ncbi:MAG TPA: hypothetical protein DEF34_08490 [Desulfotomaculum sp.]|nr:hypothetical protein [Desulfotomaculum sp.]